MLKIPIGSILNKVKTGGKELKGLVMKEKKKMNKIF